MSERMTKEQVSKVAELARLRLTEPELEHFTGHLGAVLEHASDMDALDVSELPDRVMPYALENVLREDEPGETLDRDELLASAPAVESDRFRVPPIMGEA